MSKTIVEVETKTFIRFWLVLLGFAAVGLFIFKSREALAIVGVSAILAIAIHPLAIKLDKLIGRQTKSKLPSVVAYLIVLLVLSAIVIAIGPLIVNEFARFVSTVPAMVASADLSKINALGDSIGVFGVGDGCNGFPGVGDIRPVADFGRIYGTGARFVVL